MKLKGISTIPIVLLACTLHAQNAIPEWCRDLPRPEYKALKRVPITDIWFEVYQVATNTFAIYEPHQSEETISYLIVGNRRAVLFDTGMGIGNIKKITTKLTNLPVVVMNSHTHNDHVGGNWQFETVYSLDTDFSRTSARGSTEDARAEIAPGEVCGSLPEGFDGKTYSTRPWEISSYIHDGERIDLGGRTLEVIATPGHTPDAISLLDRSNGLLFTGDTFYPWTIWIYRPETDIDAYAASIHRLADLAPKVKVVLGAHNFPVAKPDVLPRLVAAFAAVRAGKVTATATAPGQVMYKVDGFGFRMRAPR
jgi:glyoxylase-like metal-dependent hydrolase (beta-lactamase superfamily II)